MRYRLRTLLIILALGPPVFAVAWSIYSQRLPLWLVLAVSLVTIIPWLLVGAFGYGFGALCHLIARLPGGRDRKDTGP
jgi:hypothetical protein